MTTFQDPQPQSRRAVRQSERGQNDPDLGAESPGFTQFPPTAVPAAPQFLTEPEAPRETWDTAARRAAQLPPAAPASNTPPAASGRRSAAPVQPAGEPLTYSTQSRSSVPSYDGPSFRSRTAPPATPVDDLAPTQAIPKAEQPAYRVRDFSPEGRRSAPTPQPTWNPSPAPAAAAPAVPLEYQTEARIAAPAAAPAPVAEVPPSLTRRELRAQQAADAPAETPADAPAPAPAAAFVAPAAAAPVEAAPVDDAPVAATDEPQAWPFGNLFPDPNATDVTSEPIAPVAAVIASTAPEPTTNTALTNAIAEFDSLTQQPAVEQPAAETPVAETPVAEQPVAAEPAREVEDNPTNQWTAPIGHWSTQAGLDDETQPYESTINRTVGSGSATTSALVLPAIPEGSDIRGPLTGTGEIMLTGSIDLPHAYSSTGASSRVEHHGIDALFDLHDAEVVPTDSQPVRAISAVSTHNSGQGVTHTQKPKGTRALTALVISAASMAVVVVGLLVAVFALNIF